MCAVNMNEPSKQFCAATIVSSRSAPSLPRRSPDPVTDSLGNPLRTGHTVTDDVFGDGIVRGTVPLDRGLGLNVLIDWLGPKDLSTLRCADANARELLLPCLVTR